MTVPLPEIQWPTVLACAGPEEDRGILLAGTATVGGVAFSVTAVRMREGQRSPDYREDIPESDYEDAFERMVGDIEDLAESISPRLLAINGSMYLLWMVPTPRD